jgi:hypothetical protein
MVPKHFAFGFMCYKQNLLTATKVDNDNKSVSKRADIKFDFKLYSTLDTMLACFACNINLRRLKIVKKIIFEIIFIAFIYTQSFK